MPSHNAEAVPVLLGWHRGFAAFDLNQDYLQSVATFRTRKQHTVILTDGDQVNNSHGFAASPSAERHQLPARASERLSDTNLRHRHSPTSRRGCSLLRSFPIDCHVSHPLRVRELRRTFADIDRIESELKKATKALGSVAGLVSKYRGRLQELCDTAAARKMPPMPDRSLAEISQ
jgi:hypothetical protein